MSSTTTIFTAKFNGLYCCLCLNGYHRSGFPFTDVVKVSGSCADAIQCHPVTDENRPTSTVVSAMGTFGMAKLLYVSSARQSPVNAATSMSVLRRNFFRPKFSDNWDSWVKASSIPRLIMRLQNSSYLKWHVPSKIRIEMASQFFLEFFDEVPAFRLLVFTKPKLRRITKGNRRTSFSFWIMPAAAFSEKTKFAWRPGFLWVFDRLMGITNGVSDRRTVLTMVFGWRSGTWRPGALIHAPF